MPELPEVETVARDLQEALVGRQVVSARVFWERTVVTPSAEAFCAELVGRTVRSVSRRGKFIRLELSEGALVVHLRMTGQLLIDWPSSFPVDSSNPYVRAVLRFDSGQALVFHDVRKFGRMWLVDDAQDVLGRLGPEPLDDALTAERLHNMLHGRRRRLKDLMLDQSFVAGLGNIYVDESLWEAALSPRRLACTLVVEESACLLAAIRAVLQRAIASRGTTLRDFRDSHNAPGRNQDHLRVYGRAGRACPRCGSGIIREVVAGRGTYYCPVCQRVPSFRDPSRQEGET